MVCIYHSRDLDGWMSAAIVKLKYPKINLIGWDYGQSVPDIKGDGVIMTDISFPMKDMVSLAGKNKWNLKWIDHHASAIKEYNEFTKDSESFCNAILDSKFAACELTWQYFFPNEKIPELVRLLGRYDCFGHKGTEEELKVLEFQYGARQSISNVEDAYKHLLIATVKGGDLGGDLVDDIHLQGKAVYKYLCTEAKHTYSMIFPIDIEGHRFACVNQVRFNPINFGIDYHKDGYDGFACFHYQNGQFTYSLYNDNGEVDCSILAKSRGGGGHKGASGFRTDMVILK